MKKRSELFRNTYDVVVIGSTLSGLISAATLAKRGAGVLYIPDCPDPLRFFDKGYNLNLAPCILPGIGREGYQKNLFDEIFAGKPLGFLKESGYQLCLPSSRIDLLHSLYEDELKREFFRDSNKMLSFYKEQIGIRESFRGFFEKMYLFSGGWWERRSIKKNLLNQNLAPLFKTDGFARLFSLNELGEDAYLFLNSQLVSTAQIYPATLNRFNVSWRMSPSREKEFDLAIDISKQVEMIHDRFNFLGVDIVEDDEIERFNIKGSRIESINFRKLKDQIRASFFVLGSKIKERMNKIPFWKRDASLNRLLNGMINIGFKRTLNVICDSKVIPEPMASCLIYAYNDKTSEIDTESYTLTINISKIGENRTLISASVPVFNEFQGEDTEIAHYRTIFDNLKYLIPFLQDFTITTFPELDKWSERSKTYCKLVEENEYNKLYKSEKEPFCGIFYLPMKSSHKNLILTGPQVMSNLGISSEMVLAQMIVDYICKKREFY